MIGLENAGFSFILQYIFWPFALVMGVSIEDCLSVGKLIGFKTFLNEFVAYKELGDVIKFRDEIFANGTQELYRNGTLMMPSNLAMIWQDKSVVIATYALCGFSNFGSVGIQIASLSALCPSKQKVFSEIASMAMIGGTLACFMTACIAGKKG
jgi:nucleoside permease NupC